ncbi:hypothetical protein X975_05822, partial [Stegodyphus mimosarum]
MIEFSSSETKVLGDRIEGNERSISRFSPSEMLGNPRFQENANTHLARFTFTAISDEHGRLLRN